MSLLGYILFFTLLGSVISLIGGILLLISKKFAVKVSHFLTSFAAGTLLGTAFFDLLPEALEIGGEEANIFLWALIGVLLFFLLERFVHHHDQGLHPQDRKSVIPLIVVGDTVHNFIDGVAMAATFLISIPLGIVTSLAVAVHEIPQEIGDFGLMVSKGLTRKKVLMINFLSASAALIGAVLTYFVRDRIDGLLPMALSLTAGFFIYIAAANLIPEIHHNENRKIAFWETVLLVLGVVAVWGVISVLEGKV
ncbi:ZIP family metal transporter [Candidatus Daviesbacteria bacterium]|nr:ZIP family metal transporter [Candidatus Daviesbacteria bacterium]